MYYARKMSVTLKDIAAKTGLSLQTVSQCVRRGPRYALYSAQTRERVRLAAEELQYRPNASAKAMASGSFGAVSLLMSLDPVRSSVFAGMLCGIHDALARADFKLLVSRLSDMELSDPQRMPRFLVERCCDGVLINYTDKIPGAFVNIVRSNKLPAVWINSAHEADCVYLDDAGASRDATEMLLSLGHRRIAYVDFAHGPDSIAPHYSANARRRGYDDTMRKAMLPTRVIIASQGVNVPPADRVPLMRQLLSTPDRPTAVLAYRMNDMVSTYVAALSSGMRVPEDLSIIGFTEGPVSHLGPSFTTVRLAEESLGQAAVEMLFKKIKDPTTPLRPQAVTMRIEPGETVAGVEGKRSI